MLFSLVYLCIEIAAFAGLAVLEKWKSVAYEPVRFELTEQNRELIKRLIDDRTGYRKLSASLGWTNKPNARFSVPHNGDAGTFEININAQGLRGKNDYPLSPDKNTIRVLAFGDSFTFGAEVGDQDCWTEKLNASTPRLEVLNFGVPGFSLDQALLRYEEEGTQFSPRIVLMGFLTENIKRHVNVYRPFLYKNGFPAAKPRFLLEKEAIELLPNPLPTRDHYQDLLENESEVITTLGKHDYFYQQDYHEGHFDILPSVRLYKILSHDLREGLGGDAIMKDNRYNTASEAFAITIELFKRFSHTVRADNALPIAVIFPHNGDIKRFLKDRTKSYSPLIEYFDRHKIDYIDLMDAFVRGSETYPPSDFFASGSHYSPLGNELVARHLLRYLER